MFSYLQFLAKSTNQHGVHSPFVYNYITKGLCQQKKELALSHKTNQWLLQSIQYFQPTKICFLDEGLSVVAWKVYTDKSFDLTTADLILEHYTVENRTRILQTINNMSNSQLLLIATYNYPKAFINELRQIPNITLVVDFYYGCLISKRTEQPKQNFFIRY
ncbi:MAG: hypothetical protein RSE50_02400 [Myroides sp.]